LNKENENISMTKSSRKNVFEKKEEKEDSEVEIKLTRRKRKRRN
jgi:hypothetical protein